MSSTQLSDSCESSSSHSSYNSYSSYRSSLPHISTPETILPIFPANLLRRKIHKMLLFKGMSDRAAVYMSAVLEYMCAELLDMSYEISLNKGMTKITPTHLYKAIKQDEEMNNFLKGVGIPWIEHSEQSSAVQSQIEDECDMYYRSN